MKHLSLPGFVVLFVAATLSACGANVTPSIEADNPSPATQPPVATEAPAEVQNTPTLEIPEPVGPPMQVGSTYSYVDGSLLVAVPGGEFIMGSDGPDNPARTVQLDDFWIYATKVTNQQYALCVAQGKCDPPDPDNNPGYSDRLRANDPVTGVPYEQAAAYCGFVNGRLPTEAEWEKTARGPQGNTYPWGEAAPTCDLLNFDNCVGATTSVVSFPGGASFYGGLDLAGNVFEWVLDWYDPAYYANAPAENPAGPESGTARSVRSSNYTSTTDQVNVAMRFSEAPRNQRNDLGFRCVVESPTYFAPFCQTAPVYDKNVDLSEICPSLDISQANYCTEKISVTNVTFSGPEDAAIDPGECTPSGNPALFVCQTKTIVSIAASCQIELSGVPGCPPGYSLDGTTCVAEGAAGQCLDGWSFDPSGQCCTPPAGQNPVDSLAICPAGTFYLASQKACVVSPAQEIVSVVEDVKLVACGAFGNGKGSGSTGSDSDGGGCPAKTCSVGDWDPDLCCCADSGQCYP